MPRPREPLAEYDVVVNGHHTTMRLRPSTVAKLYPGAVPRHRARLAPEPVTPAPPGPPVAGVLENLGGGWWRLPDGSRVRGREAAEEALAGS